jgi:predicted ABC-class ATPase
MIETLTSLVDILINLDGRGYKSYKQLQKKSFHFGLFKLTFEHVQGDPFAQPSRLSVLFDLREAGFPKELFETSERRLALEDFLLRKFFDQLDFLIRSSSGSGKSGIVEIYEPSQKILKRNATLINQGSLQLFFFAGLPGAGRTILGKECAKLFSETIPMLLERTLLAASLNLNEVNKHFQTLEDYSCLSQLLDKNEWVAFIADGSILPRTSGISEKPLAEGVVRFRAPDDFFEEVELPHAGKVRGMSIKSGSTLIVGGGFHGKSALLKAIQAAVYPHIPGDGREYVATIGNAVKIRAEDGRLVKKIDVSGFMNNLPSIESTKEFSTVSASGSTSQAANILEAMEAGCKLLLMDEDTCAANFMIRDSRMQQLIRSEKEPITPFIDRMEELFNGYGVSTILVMGGSGDYFQCADYIIAMDVYLPRLVTKKAKQIFEEFPNDRKNESSGIFPKFPSRKFDAQQLTFARGKKGNAIDARGLDYLDLGTNRIDTRYLEQLSEVGQLEACGWILKKLKAELLDGAKSNRVGGNLVFDQIRESGFEYLTPFNNGRLSLPRLQEVLAVFNRLR